MKSFHGVSAGNVHEYSLKSRIGKVRIARSLPLMRVGAMLAINPI
jgi:hypothetical protein